MSYDKPIIDVHEADDTNPHDTDIDNLGSGAAVAGKIAVTDGLGGWTLTDPVADTDEKVKVTADDTTAGYLLDKVVGTSGKITLTETNPGANEDLTFNIGTDVFDKTSDDTDDVTQGATNLFNQTHTGEVTGATALTIATDVVDNTNLSNMAQSTIKGRAAGSGTGDPQDLTPTQVRTIINVEDGSTKGVDIEDEGAPVTGTPHTTLDFVGAGVVVTNAGGGEATITISGGGTPSELAICQARRTTDFAVTGSWSDVSLDTTDEESDSAVIEHDAITDRIVLKEAGNYLIGYGLNVELDNAGVSVDTTIEARLRINDVSVIPGTFSRMGQHYSGSGLVGEDPIALRYVVISASANDYITLQVQRTDGVASTFDAQDCTVIAARLQGSKGDTGDTGAGSNIIVQEDDVTVGTVTDTLNFEGTAITSVVDDGGNKTTVTVDGALDGQVILNDTISPVIGSSQNDWNPAGLSTANVIRVSGAANYDITGIVAQPAGTLILVVNIGSGSIKLKNQSGLSIAANRFAASADMTIDGNEAKWIWYDGVTSRWRHTQI